MDGVKRSEDGGALAPEGGSRRRFLSRAVKALLGGLAFRGVAGGAASGDRRPPNVSWREAAHYAKTRKLAG
jgi:hypothetical protein